MSQAESSVSESVKTSLHFRMTEMKIQGGDSYDQLNKSQLSELEKLSNELSKTELKDIIANLVSIADDGHIAFSEIVYVRAKILIM